MRIPVFCPNCGSIFPSVIGDVSNIRRLVLSNNKESCPVCGFRDAIVSEGIFRVTNEAIEVISAPDLTVTMLNAFAEIANRAAKGEISKERGLKEAEAISPKLGTLFGEAANIGLSALTLLATVVGLYLIQSGNKSAEISNEKLLTAVSEQTIVFKKINENVEHSSNKPSNLDPNKESRPSLSAPIPIPKAGPKRPRRAQVNNARREVIKRKRAEFGGARTH